LLLELEDIVVFDHIALAIGAILIDEEERIWLRRGLVDKFAKFAITERCGAFLLA